VNKAVATRSNAWLSQGGLKSIGTAAAFGGQIPAMPARTSVIDANPPRTFTAVPIKSDIADMTKKTKTPSPRKLTVKIEAAGGKENFPVHATPQSTCWLIHGLANWDYSLHLRTFGVSNSSWPWPMSSDIAVSVLFRYLSSLD
jgi:hypothetical protein